jgi:hypothetical protein
MALRRDGEDNGMNQITSNTSVTEIMKLCSAQYALRAWPPV